MAMFGFRPEDYGPDEQMGHLVKVLPCNWPAFRVFHAMSTQWHAGMGGPTGLIYSALPEMWKRLHIPPAERDDVFEDLQTLELAALAVMHEKTGQK